MAEVKYDVSSVKPPPPSKRLRERTGKRPKPVVPDEQPEAGSFAARVGSRERDLVQLVEEGLPPLEFLPASVDMLVRGKRHLVAAPHKTGKSIGMETHWVDMALAGGRVAILDRENGADIYASRLSDILDARKLKKVDREKVRSGLAYYEFPQLGRDDATAMAEHFATCDLVVFDAQRMFLSDFGLKEADSDDYAQFMFFAVDPLFRAGIATLILDNTGHNEKTRSRGSSAKGDLNEVLFSMDTLDEFDLYRQGRLRLRIERSRFGTRGDWTMQIGGGTYGGWLPVEERPAREDFRRAVLAGLAEGQALGQDKLITAARKAGVKIGTSEARQLLGQYVADASVPLVQGEAGYSLREAPDDDA